MSAEGVEWLAELEGGYRLEAYLCPAGVWTISAGVTMYQPKRRVKQGDKLASVDEAKSLFARTLKTYEHAVDALTRDDLKPHEFDALTSFVYNVGPQAAANSTLFRLVNLAASGEAVEAQFKRWIYSNGEALRGLVLRRRAEAACFAGDGYLGYDDVREAA